VGRGHLVSRTNLTGIGPADDLFAFRPRIWGGGPSSWS